MSSNNRTNTPNLLLPNIPKFLLTLRQILQEGSCSRILSWNSDGKSFKIYDLDAMISVVLPSYFNHSKFASFHRQLNYFGFKKITKTKSMDSFGTYYHPYFQRDIINDDSVLRMMPRRTHCRKHLQQYHHQQHRPCNNNPSEPTLLYKQQPIPTWNMIPPAPVMPLLMEPQQHNFECPPPPSLPFFQETKDYLLMDNSNNNNNNEAMHSPALDLDFISDLDILMLPELENNNQQQQLPF